ncbi:hypothetical protein [Persicobacter psychrovividus]
MGICFLSAFGFWLLTALQKTDHRMVIKVPIGYRYNQSELSVMKPLPAYVQVEVSGEGWNLLKQYSPISDTPIEIILPSDASRKYITSYGLNNDVHEFLRERELHLERILTDTLRFDIDKKVRKKVKLAVEIDSISLAPGYRILSAISTFPDSLELLGPAHLLKKQPDVFHVKLPLNNIEGEVNEQIDIAAQLKPYISIFPSKVRVAFDVDHLVTVNRKIKMELKHFDPKGAWFINDSSTYIQYDIRSRDKDLDLPFRVGLDFWQLDRDSMVMPDVISIPKHVENVHLDSGAIKILFKQPVVKEGSKK